MKVRIVILLLVVGGLALFAGLARPAAASRRSCGGGYEYAGVVAPRVASGIDATLTLLAPPTVRDGHVAAWVGVGGPGAGPRGAAEWLQVGLSGFAGGQSNLYYEVKAPHRAAAYHELLASLDPGERHEVAVREVRGNRWRVWVDGRPVSRPIALPGSHGHWQPMAMTESWTETRGSCNGFRYGFSRVRLAARSGRRWRPFLSGSILQQGACRILARRRNHFVGAGV